MTEPLRPINFSRDTLADVVYARLREAIVTQAIAPGSRITEADTARRLRVSKTPVREALLRLKEVGLIESDDKNRARVVNSTPAALADACEIRGVLETYTARKAALDATAGHRRAIMLHAWDCLASAERDDADQTRNSDLAFHLAIALAAGNPRIAAAINGAQASMRALYLGDDPSDVVVHARNNLKIAERIEAGDADAAAESMTEHMLRLRHVVLGDGRWADDLVTGARRGLSGRPDHS